jgi:hypothetical protein
MIATGSRSNNRRRQGSGEQRRHRSAEDFRILFRRQWRQESRNEPMDHAAEKSRIKIAAMFQYDYDHVAGRKSRASQA